jgi:hypothetical protein
MMDKKFHIKLVIKVYKLVTMWHSMLLVTRGSRQKLRYKTINAKRLYSMLLVTWGSGQKLRYKTIKDKRFYSMLLVTWGSRQK